MCCVFCLRIKRTQNYFEKALENKLEKKKGKKRGVTCSRPGGPAGSSAQSPLPPLLAQASHPQPSTPIPPPRPSAWPRSGPNSRSTGEARPFSPLTRCQLGPVGNRSRFPRVFPFQRVTELYKVPRSTLQGSFRTLFV